MRALSIVALTRLLALGAGLGLSAEALPVKARPGQLTGAVKTTTGRPVAGARVNIFGFTKAGTEFRTTARTGNDGVYAVTLPAGGLYRVSNAFAPLKTAQGVVDHRLHPLERNFEVLSSNTSGLVRNFELRLSGLKPAETNASGNPRDPVSYYGQIIRVLLTGDGPTTDQQSTVLTFRLMPVGRLADGSEGRTLTLRRTVKHLRTEEGLGFDLDKTQLLHDVPLGVYSVTATVSRSAGAAQGILLSLDGSARRPAVTVNFRPSESTPGTSIFNVHAHLEGAAAAAPQSQRPTPAMSPTPAPTLTPEPSSVIRGHINAPNAYPGNVLLVLEDYAITPEDALLEVRFRSLDGAPDLVVRRTLRQIRAGNVGDNSRPLTETGYLPLLNPGAFLVSAALVSAHGEGRTVDLRPDGVAAGREVPLRWAPAERYGVGGGKVVYVTINRTP
ncbi:carboxypeptidase regulatory-like domain-containing protein [Deinococcus deserti]|uniref:carboxypeptidase regulatory-like domain-containing protein n=1 Tax=Deinococcus deserti TaxID=310783 RepID=UPI001F5722E1|nr:carboxypeptidase regulatory-like domain-containing protein [Deinococcus deserti]